jgi:tetratricopeptide (TPR) repeat protein
MAMLGEVGASLGRGAAQFVASSGHNHFHLRETSAPRLTTGGADSLLPLLSEKLDRATLVDLGIAFSHRTDKNLKSAAAVLQKAHKRFPDFALAPSLQADVEISRMIRGYVRPAKQATAALKLVEVALSLQPNLPSALATKGFLIGMTENNIMGGLYLITEALKSGPPSWLAEFYKAWLLIGHGQLDRAEAALNTALAITPLERVLLALKGWVLCAQNRYNEAAFYIDESLTFRPDVDLLWIIKALIHVKTDEWDAAEKAIAEAVRLYPDDTFVQAYHAWIKAKTGRKSEAICFLQGISDSSTSYISPTHIAAIRLALGDQTLTKVSHDKVRVDKDPWRLLAWCDPRFT